MKFRVICPYSSLGAEGVLKKYPRIAENFKFEIIEREKQYNTLFVEINTLEELMRFKDVTCNSIVIDEEDVITIYDGYIE